MRPTYTSKYLRALLRRTVRRSSSPPLARGFASTSNSKSSSNQPPKAESPESTQNVASLCLAGTEMTGLNYLKGELPVLAKPDEEYPAWLWDLTKPKVLVDDGPGGKAEKRRLRLSHRQTLKDNNLFKAK